MRREKKLQEPITLFATIEARQHEALRTIAFNEHRSIADVVREAIDEHVKNRQNERKNLSAVVVSERKVEAASR